jgi:beta-glucosidase
MHHWTRSFACRCSIFLVAAACGAVLIACSAADPATPPVCTTPAAQPATWPRVTSEVPRDPKIEQRIAELLSRLTLEQKVAQMVQADIRYVTPQDVRKYRLGSILNGGGAWPANNKHAKVSDWVALADEFYDASMDTSGGAPAIPVIWGVDAVHGHNNVIGATLFPHNVGLGAAHDPELMQRIGEITAIEVAATGLDWTFAPTVAVVRDDRWGRSYEGYSEDPEVVKQYAGRMIHGLQGALKQSTFLDNSHIVATAKHYIGDGGTFDGIDRGDNRSSEQELLTIHAQGYLSAIHAGAQTVMVSYNSWRGLKVHGQEYLLTDVLKNKLGFDGLIVSDWDGIDEVQACSKDKCAQAVNAGIDLFMVPMDWKNFLSNTVEQVRSGVIAETRIDDAVSRILRVKLRAGLFEKGRPSSRPLANQTALIGAADHRAVAREAVRESLVLLKNENKLLPLSRKSNVLVAGDGADNISKQSGGWTITWQGSENTNADFPGATSIFEGIRTAVMQAGGEATLSIDGRYRKRPDVAIVVFGENPYAEWHGDIRSLEYPSVSRGAAEAHDSGATGDDLALLRRLAAEKIPVVAVFLTGRALYTTPEIEASDAFVVVWLPGSEGGGIADVLFRKASGEVNYNFTGKLPYSWPRDPSQTSLNREHGKYDPLFAYGFGLTY